MPGHLNADHLNDDQLEMLLHHQGERTGVDRAASQRTQDAGQDAGAEEAIQTARAHLEACAACRNRMENLSAWSARLAQIRSEEAAAPGGKCPTSGISDEVWHEIAAGVPLEGRELMVRHAAECDRCGILLRHAAEDLADDETAEETMLLDALANDESAQRRIAERMIATRATQEPVLITAGRKSAPRRPWPVRNWVLAGSLVAAAAAVAVVVWLRIPHSNPQALVAQAFAEKRTMDLRIEGAPYAPLRQERGAPGEIEGTERLALMKAKAEIMPELKRHPEDAWWLQQAGRLYLIENNPNSVEIAKTLLEKAHNLDRNNVAIQVDLASAYILSADLTPQSTDIGNAINLLEPLADSDQGGETALWNYALAEDRMKKWNTALEAWQKFVRLYPHSDWAKEAQQYLDADQRRVDEERQHSTVPLKTMEQVAAAYTSRDAGAIAAIDRRIEEYQDAAVTEWLPKAFAGDAQADTALHGLAGLLSAEHGDRWLTEMLSADRNSPAMREAVQLLAQSARSVETTDAAAAEREAQRAAVLFHSAGLRAGELRAELVSVFAGQYEHRDAPCVELARKLDAAPDIGAYQWIAIQADLETAFCSSGGDEEAMHAAEDAARRAQTYHFPAMAMRALNAESMLYLLMGDRNRAWARGAEAFAMYRTGSVPRLRGYNALISLYETTLPDQQWALQADLLKEAIPLVEGDPRALMVAVAHAQLGEALIRTGNLAGAEKEYHQSQQLIAGSAQGRERDALWAETELGIARIDLERDRPKPCIERLEHIRALVDAMLESPMQAEFYETSGTALLRLNRLEESAHDLAHGVDLARHDLRQIASDEDRWKTSRRYLGLYRSAVEEKLRSDARAALMEWESLKGASLPADAAVSRATPSANGPELVLSYMALPKGLVAWAWDAGGVREQWISLDMSKVAALSARFIEECSDPNSDLAALQHDGAELYTRVIRPVEPWLGGHRQILLEPDGPLRRLPFALLADAQGAYLGDRFDLAISPGIAYLSGSRPWEEVSSRSAAFILANPQAPGWTPLPAADEEARVVASFFAHPRLVSGTQVSGTSGTAASAAEVSRAIAEARLFHFTGHAFNSFESAGLVAGPFGRDAAREFAALRSGHTALVVLSACNTSAGSDGLFDGDSSMVRTLLAAHVPDVVASRWNVDSSSTALLMKLFYSGLMQHKSVSAALAEATRGVRAVPAYRHPYYWAAFSVYGRG